MTVQGHGFGLFVSVLHPVPITVGLPVISGLTDGVAVAGSTVTVLVGGVPAGGAIQWLLDAGPLAGETAATLSVPASDGGVLTAVVDGRSSAAVGIVVARTIALGYPGAVPNPGDTVTVTVDGQPATSGAAQLLVGGTIVGLSGGGFDLRGSDLGAVIQARQTLLPSNSSAPETVVSGGIPVLAGAPSVSGSTTAGGTRTVAADDSWTEDGAPAQIAARDYRLVVDGTPGAAQSAPALILPATAGASAQIQLRAQSLSMVWSPWEDAEASFVIAAAAPGQIAPGAWAIADAGTGGDATVTVTALPGDGGSAITGLFARIDGGAGIDLGGTAAGSYPLNDVFTDGVAADVALFARNAAGDGPDSAVKTVTTTGAAPGSWAIADNGDGTFDIDDAPAAEAAPAITDNGDGTFDVAA